MGWQWLVLLIFTSLSCYRLTRLIVEDEFPLVAKPREWVVGKDFKKHEGRWYYWFGELISCPWCASGWVSLGLTVGVAVSNKQGTWIEWLLLWWATWAAGSVAAAKIG